LLSRRRAGVPAGTRGRLGGFLSRRTRTLPVRAAAARLEGPPERAKTIRDKRTCRRGGVARKNADRPQARPHAALPGCAVPPSDHRLGERSRRNSATVSSGSGRCRVTPPLAGMTSAEADEPHSERASHSGSPPERPRDEGGRGRPPWVRQRRVVVWESHDSTVMDRQVSPDARSLPNPV
jgi:hypothetical protein